MVLGPWKPCGTSNDRCVAVLGGAGGGAAGGGGGTSNDHCDAVLGGADGGGLSVVLAVVVVGSCAAGHVPNAVAWRRACAVCTVPVASVRLHSKPYNVYLMLMMQ